MARGGSTVSRRADLARLDAAYVECRSWGHQWDTFRPLRRRAAWGVLLSLRCERCGCERHDTIDSTGQVSAREYKYPDGYKLAGERQGDRLTAGELRLEVLRRLRKGRG
jgi:hypothetical protein